MTTGTDTKKAACILRSGGLAAIPTETVYGLAANALNPNAVTRIFEAKKRPAFDPLIVHVPHADAIKQYAHVSGKLLKKLIARFCPGPVTFILPKKEIIPDIVTSGLDTVAVRIPDHPLTLELLNKIDFPLAAPSANPFGYTSPTTAEHVFELLGDRVDYILNGGSCQVGIESTIIQITEKEELIILRLGGLTVEEIEAAAERPVTSVKTSSSKPAAPGMLKSHYNPGIPVYLGNPEKIIAQFPNKKIAAISFRTKTHDVYRNEILSKNGDLNEAAQNLFSALRKCGTSGADIIIAEPAPDKGLGKAINDRLKRAAAKKGND